MSDLKTSVNGNQLSPQIQSIGLAGSAILAGLCWIILTPLEGVASGRLEFILRSTTEPIVAVLALLGIYGLLRVENLKPGRLVKVGSGLLLAGFLIVGVPTSLQNFLEIPGLWFALRQPDSMLITTVPGLFMIYPGFILLGLGLRTHDYSFGKLPAYIFISIFPIAIVGFFLFYSLDLPHLLTTAVIAPAGLGLTMMGSIIYTMSDETTHSEPGVQK